MVFWVLKQVAGSHAFSPTQIHQCGRQSLAYATASALGICLKELWGTLQLSL